MRFCLLLLLIFQVCTGFSQTQIIKGRVEDMHSEETIPFASVVFQKSNIGQLTDSAGNFIFRFTSSMKGDSLAVSYVGYQTKKIFINSSSSDTLNLVIKLDRVSLPKEVVIKSKYSKGWMLWRKVVKNKARNDRARFDNYGYELYNKLELDINGFNSNRFNNIKFLKPFGFIIDQTIDTVTEEKPILPVFISESISDLYYQRNPLRKREEIKASRTSGVKNESFQKLLGGMKINDNIYNNYIEVFDKRFISPVADNGDVFYQYRLPDTQYVGGKRLLHLVFTPKHKGENTFEGECWIHDSTYAVQKVSLHLSKEANVNFVNKYAFIQEYKLLGDSVWFLAKDKLVVDFSPLGKQRFGVIAKKTTTYKNVQINDGSVWEQVRKNKTQEDIIMLESAGQHNDDFWRDSRHESLNVNEKAIYTMVDTLEKMPLFKTYKNTIEFLATGYKSLGKLEYGPWFNAISINAIEGFRTRLDMGTSSKFSKKWRLAGYLAYGSADQQFKGRAEILHIIKKSPRTSLYASFVDDYDNGQVYYDEVGMDNVFTLAARKTQIPIKFLRVKQEKFEFLKETNTGFSFELTATRKEFRPVRSLPDASIYSKSNGGDGLTNTELSMKIRFAYLERFLEGDFFRTSLGSPYPITELKYSKGLSGVLGGGYDYHKINISVHDYQKVAYYGELYYNIFAGKIWGTLPFPILEVHPGNEIYYYNKYAFNLMNRFEYLSDQFAGINVEHNIGAGIFRLFGPSRKLKLRQFWNAKILWGKLSEENKKFNQFGTVFDQGHEFRSLDDNTYMELGTGVNNIFKFIRVDFVWRVLPLPFPKELYKQFGVFGSFQLQF